MPAQLLTAGAGAFKKLFQSATTYMVNTLLTAFGYILWEVGQVFLHTAYHHCRTLPACNIISTTLGSRGEERKEGGGTAGTHISDSTTLTSSESPIYPVAPLLDNQASLRQAQHWSLGFQFLLV